MNAHMNKQPTKPNRAASPPVCMKQLRTGDRFTIRTLAEHEARQREIATLALVMIMTKYAEVRAS